MSKGKILFQLSGSIACFKACQLLSRLVQEGYEVETVATASALKFVGEATLEGLTGKTVNSDVFERGSYMDHIHLMRWADLVLLCPASANSISKMASGIGDDLLTTLFLAHDFKKPYLLAPAMNTQMMRHPATQAALAQLTSWGVEILGSGEGRLACGEEGEGRLLEPDLIFQEIEKRLGNEKVAHPLSVLITSGGTREPIDGVRSIANTSTGRTGAAIAEYFSSRGHSVTFLSAEGSAAPEAPERYELRGFVSFDDLKESLSTELKSKSYDAIIHAAAVSDYSVSKIENGGKILQPGSASKIESSDELTLKLRPNPKLVDQLKSLSKNPKVKVVAFKLTNTQSSAERMIAVEKLAAHAAPDLIVHNDLNEISPDGKSHLSTVFSTSASQTTKAVASADNKSSLARALAHEIEKLATEVGP